MPVFRVEKNSNYTTMCNYHLRDHGLSLKGKGLLSMLLSLPDTWNYSVRGLSSITPDGVDGVLTALKELERLGYLERNQQRESNGRMGRAEYVIYEMSRKKPCSESPCTEKPYTVNPDTDTPVTENPAQLSTNRTSPNQKLHLSVSITPAAARLRRHWAKRWRPTCLKAILPERKPSRKSIRMPCG